MVGSIIPGPAGQGMNSTTAVGQRRRPTISTPRSSGSVRTYPGWRARARTPPQTHAAEDTGWGPDGSRPYQSTH